MRLRQITEAERRKMGRDLNHLEDLVLFYGSEGAAEAIEILHNLTSDNHDISLKWDGIAALFYGRDENGDFGMGTKGNWHKNEPMQSPEQIRDYIKTAGKGEDWRAVMAEDFYQIYPMLERSVPLGFKGFVMGDLIYSPVLSPKTSTSDGIVFTPNKVTYTANPKTAIGKRVAETHVGIALHQRFDGWNSPNKAVVLDATVKTLNSNEVLAMGQTYAPKTPKLDDGALKKLEILAKKSGPIVDALIERRKGLSDISNILYTFNNQTVRGGDLSKVNVEGFFKWLATSKVSANKQAKLAAIAEENPTAFPALFELFKAVGDAKNMIIDQVDSEDTDIKASTAGQAGGEGYVSLKNKVKLVPRHRWTPG